MATSIDNVAKEIVQALKDFQGQTNDSVQEAVTKTAKATVKQLKATSPVRSGDYAKGWAVKTEESKRGKFRFIAIVHQRGDTYRLMHLLERGHALVAGGRKVGHASAKPHIAAAEEAAINMLHDEIVQGIERG